MSLFRRRYSPRFDASLLQQEENQMIWQKYTILAIVVMIAATVYWTYKTQLDEVTIAQGKVLPFEEVFHVQHSKTGRITKVLVKEGEFVKQNDLLAILDPATLEDEKGGLELQLQTILKRKQYFDQQYSARKQLTSEGLNSKLALISMKMSREELKGQIIDINYRLSQIERLAKENEIRAPIKGWIYNLKILPDQVLQVGQTLCEIVPETAKLIAELQISAKDIGHIHVKQKVLIKINSYDFARYGGIHSILTSIAPISGLANSGDLSYRAQASHSGPHRKRGH